MTAEMEVGRRIQSCKEWEQEANRKSDTKETNKSAGSRGKKPFLLIYRAVFYKIKLTQAHTWNSSI